MELFSKNDPQPWLKPGVFVGGILPIPVMIWLGLRDQLGANIIATVLNQLGYLALIFLVATLLCTPLKIATGWSLGIRLRRMLGLFAFAYATLHFLTYFLVDQSLNIGTVIEDITQRNFILVGFLALVMMIPLAITSTGKMVRRMGFRSWKRLHRLTYVAGCLGVIHFIWKVKIDLREPLIFLGLIVLGFALRGVGTALKSSRKRVD